MTQKIVTARGTDPTPQIAICRCGDHADSLLQAVGGYVSSITQPIVFDPEPGDVHQLYHAIMVMVIDLPERAGSEPA